MSSFFVGLRFFRPQAANVTFNHRHDRSIDLGPAVDDFCAQVRVHARP